MNISFLGPFARAAGELSRHNNKQKNRFAISRAGKRPTTRSVLEAFLTDQYRKIGDRMVKKLQPLNLTEVNPAVPGEFILNPSGDPDCANFGVAPDFAIPVFKGKHAA